MTTAIETTLRDARTDAVIFADRIANEPLWDHQADIARNDAKTRVLCCGRQSGKTRTLAVLALHRAFAQPGALVLIASAGEDAAKDVLAEISMLAAAPALSGSVLDDDKTTMTLSNGSTIRAVPASVKQIRGKAVDLLIIDEAAWVDDAIWEAAKYTLLSRPDARAVLSSSPHGRRDRFFALRYKLGCDGDPDHASFHWPAHVSPLVDKEWLERERSHTPEREWRQEVLAEWVDEYGAYFTHDELMAAVADYTPIDPKRARGQLAVGGIDWGVSHDANALVLLGVLADGDLNAARLADDVVFFVAHLEEHFGMPYQRFIDRLIDVTHAPTTLDPGLPVSLQVDERADEGFEVRYLASETNGVGQMPTEVLVRKMWERGRRRTYVRGIHTDARRKQTAFGTIKLLLQQGRLVLPRHPTLLRQLEGLEFETLDSGNLRIAVPERVGHDDIAMALAHAASCVQVARPVRFAHEPEGDGEVLTTDVGTRIVERPRCWNNPRAFNGPRGGTIGEEDW